MKNGLSQSKPKRSKAARRVATCLFILGIAAYTFWQINGPSRRARQMHGLIQTGMNPEKVESLFREGNNRNYIFYQVLTNGNWRAVTREEFTSTLGVHSDVPTSRARVQLTFVGLTPNRVSFFVEIDSTGHVINVTDPYGWD